MRPKGMTSGSAYSQRVLVLQLLAAAYTVKDVYTATELDTVLSKKVSFNLATRYKLQKCGLLECNRSGRHSTYSLKVTPGDLLHSVDMWAIKMVQDSPQTMHVIKKRQAKITDYKRALKEARARIAELEAQLARR